MAYTDPNTVQNAAAGQPLQAARLDADRDALEHLARNKPHARVYNSSNFSHSSSGSFVAVTFNSERYDVGGCHSTVSNTSRLTVPSGEGGKYHIGGSIEWAANGTGVRILGIRVNGSTIIVQDRKECATDTTPGQTVSADYALSAADYVELIAFQNSGGALNITAASAYSPEFWFRWVAL